MSKKIFYSLGRTKMIAFLGSLCSNFFLYSKILTVVLKFPFLMETFIMVLVPVSYTYSTAPISDTSSRVINK